MGLKMEGWRLAGAQEVGDVLHLDEGHCRVFESDTRWAGCKIDKSEQ